MKSVVKKIIHTCYRNFVPKRIGHRVLMYHSISDIPVAWDPSHNFTVKVERFKKQIEILKNYKIRSVDESFSLSENSLSITFDDGYRDNLTVAAPLLRKNNLPFCVFVTTSSLDDSSGEFLSESELRELSEISGVTIGSHSRDHIRLAELSDDTVYIQLKESKERLEEIIGKRVTNLAYPYGSASKSVAKVAKELGYEKAYCSYVNVNTDKRNPLFINRLEINTADDLNFFEDKIQGNWDWFRFFQNDPSFN